MSQDDITRQFNQNKEDHKIMSDKIDELGKGQQEIKITLASLPELLAEKFDERYASKKYETALDRLNWLVISTIVVAVIGIIVKIK